MAFEGWSRQEEIEEVGSAYAGDWGKAGELDKSRRTNSLYRHGKAMGGPGGRIQYGYLASIQARDAERHAEDRTGQG